MKNKEREKNYMPDHKIAVISDTHSLLRPEIIEKIKEILDRMDIWEK